MFPALQSTNTGALPRETILPNSLTPGSPRPTRMPEHSPCSVLVDHGSAALALWMSLAGILRLRMSPSAVSHQATRTNRTVSSSTKSGSVMTVYTWGSFSAELHRRRGSLHTHCTSAGLVLRMRLVPWCGWSEWTSVGAALLSGGDDATVALSRVATWRARGTRLPLAVDVTALLVEARGHDAAYTNIAAGTCVSESALRSLYALALVRLVNGATDPKQKGRFAAPVATLARQAGLPPLLVDVRHEVRAPLACRNSFHSGSDDSVSLDGTQCAAQSRDSTHRV